MEKEGRKKRKRRWTMETTRVTMISIKGKKKNNLPVLPMGLNIIEILPELVSDSLLSLSGRATAHNSENTQGIIQMGY